MKQAIKIGTESLDLDENTQFSVTKRVANIGLLERQSSFINKLDIPITSNNLKAVGLVQGNDESNLKYTRQIGSVVSNGIEVMSHAEIMAQQVDNRISLLINGDNSVFIDQVSKLKLRDLDLSELDHVWNKDNVFASRLNGWEDGYIYGIHDTGNQSRQNNILQCQGVVPQIFAKYLFEKIAANFGYTFEGEFWTNAMFEKIVCFITEARTGQRIQNQVKVSAEKLSTETYTGLYNYFVPITNWTGATTDVWGVWNNNKAWGYEVKFPGTYTFLFNFNADVTKTTGSSDNIVRAKFRIICYKVSAGATTVIGINEYVHDIASPIASSLALDVKIEDYVTDSQDSGIYCICQVYQQYSAPSGAGVPFYDTTITISDAFFGVSFIDADLTHYNRPISIQDSLPDWTCGNFIKQICNLAGVIPIVNEYDKKVRLMMFKELNDNKVSPYKWQSKMDTIGGINYKFKFDGLAKVMRFVYKDDDRFTHVLNVDNEQLIDQTDYIKSDFMYSPPAVILGQYYETSLLPLWDASKSIIKFDKVARLGIIQLKPNCPDFTSPNEIASVDSGNASWVYFRKNGTTYGLDWDTLYADFYETVLQGMTNGTLTIETNFRLTEFDISDFDWSIPVYLNNPSGYYFVQQLKDFTSSDQSTSVEMVRIG